MDRKSNDAAVSLILLVDELLELAPLKSHAGIVSGCVIENLLKNYRYNSVN